MIEAPRKRGIEMRRVLYRNPNIETPEVLSQIAMRMFSRASNEYPNSFPAQGAAIAKQCRQERWHPAALLTALNKPAQIAIVVEAANTRHREKGIKEVDYDDVVGAIRDDFSWAEMMIELFESELDEVLDGYTPLNGEPKSTRSAHEMKYAQETRMKINAVKMFGQRQRVIPNTS